MSQEYDLIVVGPSGVMCKRCGQEKTRVKKKRREKGKGWHAWTRCDACIQRIEGSSAPLVGGKGQRAGWRVTVDGEEYNRLIAQFGGAKEYNKARDAALKANPLLVALEFKACQTCGKCMTCTEEVRHDRGGVARFRWYCMACRNEQIRQCTSQRTRGTKELTEKGRLIVEQRGWTRAQKDRAKLERSRAKRVATRGWTKEQFRKYGITQERYVELLEQQGYKCAMPGCNFVHRYEEWFALPPRRKGQKQEHHHSSYLLVVDHCHSTGEVRALLCPQCNLAVGMVETMTQRGLYVWSLARYAQDHNMRIARAKHSPGSIHHVANA